MFWSYCDRGRDMDTSLQFTQPTRSKVLEKLGEKTPIRPRVTRSDGKIRMSIFWDSESVFLVDFCHMVLQAMVHNYASLFHRLRFSIREKHHGQLRRSVLLLQDNAPIHKFHITQAAIQYTSFAELNHPAYSSDIAASDYQLFSNMKNFPCGRNFETDDEAIMTSWSLDSDSFFLSKHRKLM